jgi:hypothetical protein
MNRSTTRLLTSAFLCTGLTTAAWAQMGNESGPVSNDREQRDGKVYDKSKHDEKHAGMNHDGMKHDRQGYESTLRDSFGISVRPLNRDMASSHDLKPGVGLVVEEVSANSLAQNGKLQKGDIIFQLEDQWVINAEQLATLLSMRDADDDFELKVYRGTDRVDLDFEFDQAALDTMNRSLSPALGALDQHTDRDLNRVGDRDRDNAGLGQNPMIIPQSFDFEDDQHDISIRTEDGVKKLLVKDKDGNVLFDGPYNTQQEREAVPADVKMKVEQVLREKVK